METPFPPFDPEGQSSGSKNRLRDISLRAIFPNLLTLLSMCSGLTAIRFASEGRFEFAVTAILIAALLDGLDGRVARILKSVSRFGAQMDSLADFLSFGVAPGILLYHWSLSEVRPLGWIAVLVYVICVGLRLARFNIMLDLGERPSWQNKFFVGIPAPAGALCVMLPVYFGIMLEIEYSFLFAGITTVFTLCIGLLMVSSLPTFSGKDVTRKIRRVYVLPIMVFLVFLVAFLFSHPWQTLTSIVMLYLVSLPFGYRSWNYHLANISTEVKSPKKISDSKTNPGTQSDNKTNF